MFFTYTQNNSGGDFIFKENKVSHFVIVEADSLDEANEIAQDVGVYFGGVSIQIDCSCCGDRWSNYFITPTEDPEIYEEPAESWDARKYMGIGVPEVIIHYKSGEIASLHYQ